MAFYINDDCIACGLCESECPVEAITEGDGKYIIDAELCTDCGNCASVCPVQAPNAAE
jgi:ferredoxin